MHIPAPILIACALLALLFLAFLFQMLRDAAKANRSLQTFRSTLLSVSPPDRMAGLNGLLTSDLQLLRTHCTALHDPMKGWWYCLENHLVGHRDTAGIDGWYLSEPPREVLTEESISERYYHSSFYQVVPGILTGLGLTATFVAILVALTGLHVTVVNDMETVTGISELIDGLSGKFLTSIIGLLLSIAFLLTERIWCERRLTDSYEDLLETTSRMLPTISGTRVELETQSLLISQTALFQSLKEQMRDFDVARSDVVGKHVSFDPRKDAALAANLQQFSEKLEILDAALEQGLRHLPQ